MVLEATLESAVGRDATSGNEEDVEKAPGTKLEGPDAIVINGEANVVEPELARI